MASTVWRGHLVFGLVSFPVRLYRAARAEKVSFKRLYRPAAPPPEPLRAPGRPGPVSIQRNEPKAPPEPEPRLNPTREAPVFRTHNTVTSATEDEPVDTGNLIKGFEFEKGQYVVLEDEELKSITPQTSKEIEIVEFVKMAEIDPVFLETSYYVAPDEAGERPYALLQEALRQSGYVGLAQLSMHRREHVVILRPGSTGMIAHTMFYPDEVRRNEEYRPIIQETAPRELDLAKRLIETMVVPFEPEKFRDTYRERLEQMIAQKVDGREVTHEPAAARKIGAAVDILQALQESLNRAKKPATPAPSAKKPRVKRAG